MIEDIPLMAVAVLAIICFGVVAQRYFSLNDEYKALVDEFNELLDNCRLVAMGKGEFVLLQDSDGTQEVAYVVDDGDEE